MVNTPGAYESATQDLPHEGYRRLRAASCDSQRRLPMERGCGPTSGPMTETGADAGNFVPRNLVWSGEA